MGKVNIPSFSIYAHLVTGWKVQFLYGLIIIIIIFIWLG